MSTPVFFMSKKVPFVDPETCIGCSACAALAPDVYEMQEDGKSKVVNGEGDSEENIQRSIDTCPVTAISWVEEPQPPAPAVPNGQEKKKDDPVP